MLNKEKQFAVLSNYVGQIDQGRIAAMRKSLIADMRAEVRQFEELIAGNLDDVSITLRPKVENLLARIPDKLSRLPDEDLVALYGDIVGVFNLMYPDDEE